MCIPETARTVQNCAVETMGLMGKMEVVAHTTLTNMSVNIWYEYIKRYEYNKNYIFTYVIRLGNP